tara:strand:- start:1846 stop:2514 length:669 start_codon:yes stop_codon:yes gene_type:complete
MSAATIARLAIQIGKKGLPKLKKLFKEYYGKDGAGLSKDQLATKLASAAQKSVIQGKRAIRDKSLLAGIGIGSGTILAMTEDDKSEGKAKADTPPAPKMRPKDLKKDTPPKTPPKKPQQFNLKTGGKGDAQTRLDEIKKEKLAAKQKALVKGSKGVVTGLKMPTADQVGLKKLPTPVRNKMGYMYGGGMAKKPRMSSMDYRKGGLLVISIDMMKKKKKGKKE